MRLHLRLVRASRVLLHLANPRRISHQGYLQSSLREASILSSLSDNKGAHNKKIRRGRGPSSGKGKTSGRGHKGQRAHGKVPAGFQGGQTTAAMRAGSRGFKNQFAADLSPLNVDRVQDWIDQGRLDPDSIITVKELCKTRCLHGCKNGVKLLARNADLLTTPINIVVSRASATAIAAIERVGGTVTTRYYTPLALQRIRQGLMDPIVSTLASKTSLLIRQWSAQHQNAVAEQQFSSTPSTTTASPGSSISSSTTSSTATRSAAEPLIPLPDFKYRLPDPARRKDLEYYRDPAHRGYLAYLLKRREGPSLFMKDKPGGSSARSQFMLPGKKGKGKLEEERLW